MPHPELMPTLILLTQCLAGVGGLVLVTSLLGTWATITDSCCGLTLVSMILL